MGDSRSSQLAFAWGQAASHVDHSFGVVVVVVLVEVTAEVRVIPGEAGRAWMGAPSHLTDCGQVEEPGQTRAELAVWELPGNGRGLEIPPQHRLPL